MSVGRIVFAKAEGSVSPLRGLTPDGRTQIGIDSNTSRVYRSDMPVCYRHDWCEHYRHLVTADLRCAGCLTFRADGVTTSCLRCGKPRNEVTKRRNRNNRARGATFERTVAKALGGRRTGPLGGRDDVVGENFAAQTKKTINFSGRQARAYLDDLARIYPTRTALVIHAEPGKDREAIVVLRLQDWIQWHGPDAVGNEGEAA